MYITATRAISPQPTFDESFFDGNIIVHKGNKYLAQEPNYMGLIAPNLLRRMGKSIRMGIGAGFPLIQNKEKVDGIIIGSAEGGLEDCFKFLNQIVVYEEGTLSPTNFVNSTPNALAGNLALMTQNINYNITHVHKGNAFENALIDAKMLFDEGKAITLLVGNVEEISDYNYNVEALAGQFKTEETTSETLLGSNTPGTVCGEGSSMFLIEKEATGYLAQIIDIEQIAYPEKDELNNLIIELLERNHLNLNDIDTLVLGMNGDCRNDYWYLDIQKDLFPTQNMFTYKNLVGDSPSSIAFGTYLATQLIAGKAQNVSPLRSSNKKVETVLVYNHYKGEQHGLILLEK